jgi:protein-L-isoaspartate O-methyltransferase
MLSLGGRRYALPPTSFTQVNESMVAPMLAAMRELLQPEPGDRLLDLYCGYGLFAHNLADTCAEVLDVDVDKDAIDAAIEHLAQAVTALDEDGIVALPAVVDLTHLDVLNERMADDLAHFQRHNPIDLNYQGINPPPLPSWSMCL